MGGLLSSDLKAKDQGRRIIVSGAGEDEANGLYLEATTLHDDKPQFIYCGKSRNNAPIVMWWASSGSQWSIRKDVPAIRNASSIEATISSTKKLWYIANPNTGAHVSGAGDMPPTSGWAVSAKANDRASGGPAKFTIDPAPTVTVLAEDDPVPEEVIADMEKRAAKYTADGE